MTSEKFAQYVTQTLSWVYPVDLDGRKEVLGLSLKTVAVHNSVKPLMMKTDWLKGGLVHRVLCAKSRKKLPELLQSLYTFLTCLCVLLSNAICL